MRRRAVDTVMSSAGAYADRQVAQTRQALFPWVFDGHAPAGRRDVSDQQLAGVRPWLRRRSGDRP